MCQWWFFPIGLSRLGGFLAALALALPLASRADTVASLLGNFTVNQYAGLQLADHQAAIRYTVVFGQLPALRELHLADSNGDGVTSQAEREFYVQRLAPTLASQLVLTVDGRRVPLKATHWSTSLPTEQGGFSLRVDVDFVGDNAIADLAGTHSVSLSNQNYAGRFGWQEMAITAAQGIQLFDGEGYTTSLTKDLTEALAVLPASGPLGERVVHAMFTSGPLPAGAHPIGPRPFSGSQGSSGQSLSQVPSVRESTWLQAQTRRIISLIAAPDVGPRYSLLAILAAALLGAFHAFSPGHGKTVVGAYLIGSRGTPRHALILGLTVTVTHTLGVFALGFATLFASEFIVPERLFPVLSLISGLLVLSMGLWMLAQRWKAVRSGLHHDGFGRSLETTASNFSRFRHVPASQAGDTGSRVLSGRLAQGRGPAGSVRTYHLLGQGGTGLIRTAVRHSHLIARHSHAQGVMHSHGGGAVHSHLPPGAVGEKVTWRGLLALGISGGMVPCPSAMVLLLAAVALNKTGFGLLLVVAFSVGLAITLTAVGLVFLYARDRIGRPSSSARWPQLLPVASAVAITILGCFLCYGAVAGAG